MAGDPYQKVTSGNRAPRSARLWNDLIDVARERHSGTTDGGSPEFGRDADLVKVQNNTNANQPQFAILGLDTPLITPTNNASQFRRQVTFGGITPLSNTHQGKFAILQAPLAVNAIGYGLIAGVTPVVLNTLNTTNQTYAEITNGNTVLLQAGSSGTAQVLWVENTNSGNANAVVRIGTPIVTPPVFSGCRVYNSGDQSINTGLGILTSITFDSEDYDTDGYHSTSSNTDQIVLPSNGVYLVGGAVQWQANTVGVRVSQIRTVSGGIILTEAQLNGNAVVAAGGNMVQVIPPTEVNLCTGNILSLQVQQDSGAARTVSANHPLSNVLWIERRQILP